LQSAMSRGRSLSIVRSMTSHREPACGFSSWRPDCVAEDAVRCETVSRGKSPCNLRFAGRISKIAGKREFNAAEFPNRSKLLDVVLPRLRSRELFLNRREGAGSIFGLAGRAAVFGMVECWQGLVCTGQARLNAGPRFARDHCGLGILQSAEDGPFTFSFS
jgi:hypothetical protein